MSDVSLHRDDFARHVPSQWRDRESSLTLTLVDVSPLATSGPWESFSMSFRGQAGGDLRQGTYALEHDVLGNLDLFIVPLEPDADGPRYECVFTRATSGTIAAGG